MPVKKKFRTMYDTQGFDDSERHVMPDPDDPKKMIKIPSMTDPSQYVPIKDMLERFGVGEIVGGSSYQEIYDEDIDPEDPKSQEKIDNAFAEEEERQKNFHTLRNKGEEALAKEHVANVKKINKAVAERKAKDSKAAEEAAIKAADEAAERAAKKAANKPPPAV